MDRRYSTMLVVAVAALFAQACSSSSSSGTGGAGGGSSSTGGATGTGGATATGGKTGSGGAGGVTAAGGANGDASTDAPKDTSTTDTSTDTPAITDSGADADPAASEKALCLTAPLMSVAASNMPFTPAQFCTLYREICAGIPSATVFATEAACETAYMGYNNTPDADSSPTGQMGCRSYHLCNAYNGGNPTTTTLNTHCPHTTGFLPGDAGPGGPCP